MTRLPSLPAALKGRLPECLAIGGSAGSVDVLMKLMPAFSPATRVGVVIAVHVGDRGGLLLSELLGAVCQLPVKEAESSEPLLPGHVYLAPPGYHLSVERDRRLALSREDPVLFSRPSIDVLLESAADACGPGLVGLVLTGANADGARGLRAVYARGGLAVVQAPEQAAWPTMPRAALEVVPEALVLDVKGLEQLVGRLAPDALEEDRAT